jgi:hypothetical protein
MIYEWVRFEGKSQDWVAKALDISQPTVSRVLQRYERWQARAEPREGGRLDHAERLRAQRWMTYERNERILASCLRMAGDMEGFIDVSKSTIRRDGIVGDGNEIRTVHSTLDRSGIASRFLRLAFRINMEQLKLTEQEPLAPLPPLSENELEEIEGEEREEEQETGDREQEPEEAEVPPLKLHKVNNCIAAESGASDTSDETCAANGAAEKMSGICMNSTGRGGPERVTSDAAKCENQDPHPGPLPVGEEEFCDAVADGRGDALP